MALATLATPLNNYRATARLCIAASPANDFRSVADPGSIAVFPPSMFKSAALSEPRAIEQLAADLLSYDIDIGVISEATLVKAQRRCHWRSWIYRAAT